MANKITSWSFSRYSAYKECPAKAKYKFIDKLKEPGSAAMDRGTEIHTKAEQYIRGNIARMPKELVPLGKEMRRLRAAYKQDPASMPMEQTWAFTADWQHTRWDDWNGCALRIKVDLAEIGDDAILVTDWKTGKFRDTKAVEYQEQLELYALGALLWFPDVAEVHTRLAYIDEGLIHPAETSVTPRKELYKLQKTWQKRSRPLLTDTKFAPTPSNACRWCHFRSGNGGPCRAG